MPEIQYVLRYEHSWWEDVDRIEPDRDKWAEMIGGVEDILERTPEIVPGKTARGSRVMRTEDYVPELPHPMYVLFRILRPAPDGLVSMRHVITEADARAGLYFDYYAEWKDSPPDESEESPERL
jgi:hypothetical protein